MNFDKTTFSPYLLRFAIEKELIHVGDVKTAAITALSRLKKDPEYYHKNYGYVEMHKAKPHIFNQKKVFRKVLDNHTGDYHYRRVS